MGRLGLYEYLAQPVLPLEGAGTRATEQDTETYDDDPGLGSFGKPSSETTILTHQDGETYDDDPGLNGLAWPNMDSTRETREDYETYDDDPGLMPLSMPVSAGADATVSPGQATAHNKRAAAWSLGTHKTGSDHETYDDDPGLAPLGFP